MQGLVLLLPMLVILFPMAYAEHFTISMPDSMNVNDEYIGHVRIPETSSSARVVILLANDTSVTIPTQITVPADSQAQTFEVYPTLTGHFEITALFDGVTHRAEFSVYEQGTIDDIEEAAIHLWLPSDTIAGTQYSGYVLLDKYSPNSRIITMAGDNVMIPDDITILPQSHSALFQFTPLKPGDAFVAAATDGESSRVETQVHEGGSISTSKQISLYSHSSTLTDNMAIIVSLENGNGVPLDIPTDIVVHIASSYGISVSDSVTIPAGTPQGIIYASVKKAGTISASSPEYSTGTINVGSTMKSLSIRIDAAPSPAMPGAIGYFFTWLEDENGELYRKPGVVEVFLTSTNRESVAFEKGRVTDHNIVTVNMVDGFYGGVLYTGKAGSADITASTSGYGADTIRVNVGAETLEGECGVWVLDQTTSVSLEFQDDVRDVLRDRLSDVKAALNAAGPGGMLSDIRDARHELYTYDENRHQDLVDAMLVLNDEHGASIEVGTLSLDEDGLKDAYLDLARFTSDNVDSDGGAGLSGLIEDVRIALVNYEFDGDRTELDNALDLLTSALIDSRQSVIAASINSAATSVYDGGSGMTPEEALQNAETVLRHIGTTESRALLDSVYAYVGEKTLDRVFVERSRAAINAMQDSRLSDSETFDAIPQTHSSLYDGQDLDRQSILNLAAALDDLSDVVSSIDEPFVNENISELQEELRILLIDEAIRDTMNAISSLPVPPDGEENARSMIEATLATLRESVDPNSRAAALIAAMAAEFGNAETLEDALAKLDAALSILENDINGRVDIFLEQVHDDMDRISLWDIAASLADPVSILRLPENDPFRVPDEVVDALLAVDRMPSHSITGINQNVFTYTTLPNADPLDLVNADLAALRDDYNRASVAVNAVLQSGGGQPGSAGNPLRLALDKIVIEMSSADRKAANDAHGNLEDALKKYYRDVGEENKTFDALNSFRYVASQVLPDYDFELLDAAVRTLYAEVAQDPREGKPVIASQLTLDIIPDTTDSVAYGVVAQYVLQDKLGRDGSSMCIVQPDEIGSRSQASRDLLVFAGSLDGNAFANIKKYGGQLDGGTPDNMVVSSTGDVTHDVVVRPGEYQEGGRYRGAILFEMQSDDPGEHEVTVSIDDHARTGLPETIDSVEYVRLSSVDGKATFTVQEKPVNALEFVSVPVPKDGGIVGLVGVVQDDSIIRYKLDTIGDITAKRALDQYVVYGNSTYSGTITADDLIPVDVGGMEADSSGGASVDLDVPEKIRVGEPFPYYYHVFSSGVPMQPNTGGRISLPDVFVTFTGNELLVPIKGDDFKITVISNAGTATETIEAVSSPLEVSANAPPGTVNVGENFIISLESQIRDIVYKIVSQIPYHYEKDQIIFEPNIEGNYTIGLEGTRSGYEPYTDEFAVVVENILNVYVQSEGAEAVPFKLTLYKEFEHSTPYSFSTKPAPLHVEFPVQHTDETGGYKFEYMTVGPDKTLTVEFPSNTLETSIETDLYVTAHYTRDIRITVLGGDGSGVYARGDIVTVRAHDTEIIPVLVYERFDGWQGDVNLRGHTDTFIAERDVVITATYYMDHSVWMLIAAVGAAMVAVFMTLKRSTKFAWTLKNIMPARKK